MTKDERDKQESRVMQYDDLTDQIDYMDECRSINSAYGATKEELVYFNEQIAGLIAKRRAL